MDNNSYKTTGFLFIILILVMMTACNTRNSGKLPEMNGNGGITMIQYTVTGTYPHNTASYTEGLLFNDNKLFESTESPDEYTFTRSVIGIDNLITGKMDVKVEIDRKKYRQSEATNGIAYDPVKDRIFVTGKLWPYVFEIEFPH